MRLLGCVHYYSERKYLIRFESIYFFCRPQGLIQYQKNKSRYFQTYYIILLYTALHVQLYFVPYGFRLHAPIGLGCTIMGGGGVQKSYLRADPCPIIHFAGHPPHPLRFEFYYRRASIERLG